MGIGFGCERCSGSEGRNFAPLASEKHRSVQRTGIFPYRWHACITGVFSRIYVLPAAPRFVGTAPLLNGGTASIFLGALQCQKTYRKTFGLFRRSQKTFSTTKLLIFLL
jgi:hypothetical protein